MTDSVERFCEVDKGHIGDHILFLTFRLLSCFKPHLYCSFYVDFLILLLLSINNLRRKIIQRYMNIEDRKGHPEY